MTFNCPRSSCPKLSPIQKDGFYFRKNDSRKIRRFKCCDCGKKFSTATNELECGQKKRRVNFPLFKLLSSGVSMRRAAWILNLNKNTVSKKLDFLYEKYKREHDFFLGQLGFNPLKSIQIDDLITIEHTKLKPLTVSCAVDTNTRLILGAQVSQIPAFGHLAALSRSKYGPRESHHKRGLKRLFDSIVSIVDENALIQSDEHKLYPEFVRRYFPKAEFVQHKSGRSCVTGQGELKKQHFDPLFSINHTYAMLRANINRLIRRTWCTTKKPFMLQKHLEIYIHAHNMRILERL